MDLFATVSKCFAKANAFNALLPNLLHNPVDQVTRAYPPLQNFDCYALTWRNVPPGGAQFTCAESALTLAMCKVWEEKNYGKLPEEQTPFSPLVTYRMAAGTTLMEMCRKLNRLAMDHFPIAEYNAASDTFMLAHGKARADKWCIVFIPADPAHAFGAHWTFTNVDELRTDLVPRPRASVLIYTGMPVIDRHHCFWRARVSPAIKEVYCEAHAQGLACDCDWRIRCDHEEAFLRAEAAAGRQVTPITLAGDEVVEGTLRAQVLNGFNTKNVWKGAHGRVRVVLKTGAEIAEDHLHSSEVLDRHGIIQETMAVFRTDKTADCSLAADIDLAPYRLALWEYTDFDQCGHFMWFEKAAACSFASIAGLFVPEHGSRYVARVTVVEKPMAWGATEDLTIGLPRKDELLARLAVRDNLDRANIMDVVRRIAAEEKWQVDLGRPEFSDWLDRTVSMKGHTVIVPAPGPNQCHSCLRVAKTYRSMCKDCKRASMVGRPEALQLGDALVTHVGFRPLWSKHFKIPDCELKDDVTIYDKHRREYIHVDKNGNKRPVVSLARMFKVHEGPQSCRGYLRGPMFLGLEPSCFPRGEGVAAQAFLVRLGVARVHQAEKELYDQCFNYVEKYLEVIDPERWEEFIAHFSGAKYIKNLEAREEICLGWCPALKPTGLTVVMAGFPKAEKSNSIAVNEFWEMVEKDTEKPRFICSPPPLFLARLGPYTHAQTKWLHRRFDHKNRLFYAGCSTPEELNEWLNFTLHENCEPWTLVDDISAMDSNHSPESFEFHKRVRRVQFPHLSAWIEAAYDAEERVIVRVGRYTFEVSAVNASGVSDTSYKNSLLCLIVRLFAIANGFRDLRTIPAAQLFAFLTEVRSAIFTAASGDDGLTRLPDKVAGIDIGCFSMARYNELWARAGFSVKSALLPPHKWRMATFLAMRPVWAGNRYEWAAEPARRLRNMFWQLDNTMHHRAWARGIARQVLTMSKPQYVLNKICSWFLKNTTGPEAVVSAINEHSPFYGLVSSGDLNERSLAEFKLDYHVDEHDIVVFESMLNSTESVLVNFDCHLLRRVFAEES